VGQTSGASGELYKGWMTGWSFEACRNLYYPEHYFSSPQATRKDTYETTQDLLVWLATYWDLVASWCAVGLDDICSRIDQIIQSVMPERPGHKTAGAAVKVPKEGQQIMGLAYIASSLASMASTLASMAETRHEDSGIGSLLAGSVELEGYDFDFAAVKGVVRSKDSLCVLRSSPGV
jgi:hypothetical protein